MAGRSRIQEQNVIDAIVGLGWKKYIDEESSAAIAQALNCSNAEAKAVLNYIYQERGLVRKVSSLAEGFDVDRPKSARRWKWLTS